MKAHLRISVKDFQRNKNLKIPLARVPFARHRQFCVKMNGQPWPKDGRPVSSVPADCAPQLAGEVRPGMKTVVEFGHQELTGALARLTKRCFKHFPAAGLSQQSPAGWFSDVKR